MDVQHIDRLLYYRRHSLCGVIELEIRLERYGPVTASVVPWCSIAYVYTASTYIHPYLVRDYAWLQNSRTLCEASSTMDNWMLSTISDVSSFVGFEVKAADIIFCFISFRAMSNSSHSFFLASKEHSTGTFCNDWHIFTKSFWRTVSIFCLIHSPARSSFLLLFPYQLFNSVVLTVCHLFPLTKAWAKSYIS